MSRPGIAIEGRLHQYRFSVYEPLDYDYGSW
jgi:hypothetical protein